LLRSEQRLRKTGDFKAVYTRGRSYVHPAMVVYVLRQEGDSARIGFSVSKKLGGSVDRNRIKRRLREASRFLLPRLAFGADFIVVARSASAESSVEELSAVMESLLRKAKVIQ
jgi:ribonuclease P protein component